ncbi:MAG TPA: hypothetical protein PLO92_09175 [Anaerolineaceae bacterium]|mgnify:FL=1|jgi:hypothetical protein|nr:hypothetical protein [Anaerolineaceae bacterium]HPY34012.1 hypothetical protein [Anaerolineaceae bacterium]HQC21983.1 hypothetical protein [Anaerolineaceae bacterium]
MLTIFSVPKPFSGQTAIQQNNAIQSWLKLIPACEVILCGNAPSVIDTAAKFGVRSLSAINCTEYGTPLLNSVFNQVHSIANFSLLCYLNADIILTDEFLEAVRRINLKKFLAVGQRTNLELTYPIDFVNPKWNEILQDMVVTKGQLFSIWGMDYLIFPRDVGLHDLPPFIVGRPRWDNWFILNARKSGIPIIDLTRVCTVVHQNHDYSHIPQGTGRSWYGPETKYNLDLYAHLVGSPRIHGSIQDSTYILTKRGLLPALGHNYLYHRLQTTAIFKPIFRPLARFMRWVFLQVEKLEKDNE